MYRMIGTRRTLLLLVAAATLTAAYGQDKPAFPYYVDLMQYTKFDPKGGFIPGSYGANGSTGVNVWGWSSTGNAAFSYSGIDDGFSGKPYFEFFIINLVNDRVVFEFSADKKLNPTLRKKVDEALKKYEIVERKADFLPFPLKGDGVEYKCLIKNVKQECSDDFCEISGYDVVIDKNGKEKKIRTMSDRMANEVFICGYFMSPFEQRILVVTAENRHFEGNNFGFFFSGCSLEKGF